MDGFSARTRPSDVDIALDDAQGWARRLRRTARADLTRLEQAAERAGTWERLRDLTAVAMAQEWYAQRILDSGEMSLAGWWRNEDHATATLLDIGHWS